MQPRRRYPSDLSDARWELIRPTLQAWRDARAGIRRPTHDLRDLMDAILYVDRTGIPWRYLPHDFPPHQTVYGYFARWEADGIFDQLTGLLRRLVREQEERTAEPSACLLDSQTVKTSANVRLADQGFDPAKKIAGRKRHIATDTLGLLLAVLVTAAGVHDSTGGAHLLDQIAAHHPGISKAWADSGYKNTVIEHAATRGIDLEVVRRTAPSRTFAVQPRRWVVERTLGWLMHHRRLARDYETHPHRSAAMIHLAAIDLMSRRLTHETTPNWRGT
ncbi:IS5 family transposase [Streptomyces sp. NPDC059506]|uniref:IS5 family transposase n=1 Tax=Streptomyces sp. NPDC059506 TaxID=3347751 RepID=UPI0036C9A368